jgi:hypothetical protein
VGEKNVLLIKVTKEMRWFLRISLMSSEGCEFTNSHPYRTRITHKLIRGVGEKKTCQKKERKIYQQKSKNGTNTAGTTKPVPEFIDPVFAKTAQNAGFLSLKTSILGLFSRKLGL